MKSIHMNIWVVGALDQLFIRGSYTQIKHKKNTLEFERFHHLDFETIFRKVKNFLKNWSTVF